MYITLPHSIKREICGYGVELLEENWALII